MNWIKQSFVFMRNNLSDALILSCLMLFCLYVCSLMGFLGVIVASLAIVILLSAFFQYISVPNNAIKNVKLFKNKKDLLLVALLLAPTNIMLGTLVGVLQGMPSFLLSITMIIIFSFICSIAYIVIMHSICYLVLKDKNFSESLTLASKNIGNHKKDFAYLAMVISTSCILGFMTYGLLLVIAIPLIFIAGFFSFHDTEKKETNHLVS